MTALTYRDAGPADAARLAELGRRSFTETFGHLYRPEDLAAFLVNHAEDNWRRELADPAFAIRVGEAGGEPVAYLKLGPPSLPVEAERPALELRQLYVLKPWHGTGAADALMRWAIAEAARRGARDLYLSVFVDNGRARRFYERYGFTFVRPYAFVVGSHADEDHIMRLSLED
ncbi:MAG TPA: GNAT family N-acetyltransferase [Allosphingosinicella sp.]|nr:GNAT family N-acetyltransferase [Allosphingosinicella sp.]